MDVFDDLHTRCFFVAGNDSFVALRAHSDRSKTPDGVRGTQLENGLLLEMGDE
jgi:hypothetical protein